MRLRGKHSELVRRDGRSAAARQEGSPASPRLPFPKHNALELPFASRRQEFSKIGTQECATVFMDKRVSLQSFMSSYEEFLLNFSQGNTPKVDKAQRITSS